MMTHRPEKFLVNGETMHRDNPETFDMPDLDERQNLQVGDLVKVILQRKDDGERFWIKITECLADNRYVGTVGNPLVYNWGISYGDEITIHAHHIIDIYEGEKEERWMAGIPLKAKYIKADDGTWSGLFYH